MEDYKSQESSEKIKQREKEDLEFIKNTPPYFGVDEKPQPDGKIARFYGGKMIGERSVIKDRNGYELGHAGKSFVLDSKWNKVGTKEYTYARFDRFSDQSAGTIEVKDSTGKVLATEQEQFGKHGLTESSYEELGKKLVSKKIEYSLEGKKLEESETQFRYNGDVFVGTETRKQTYNEDSSLKTNGTIEKDAQGNAVEIFFDRDGNVISHFEKNNKGEVVRDIKASLESQKI